ncbi:hypothetical protein HDU98_000576 [Podochytrium sp. JEL0797]|nr:hypothetical protein HDU98_000576 [Podochytrium sp. JEL0797]
MKSVALKTSPTTSQSLVAALPTTTSASSADSTTPSPTISPPVGTIVAVIVFLLVTIGGCCFWCFGGYRRKQAEDESDTEGGSGLVRKDTMISKTLSTRQAFNIFYDRSTVVIPPPVAVRDEEEVVTLFSSLKRWKSMGKGSARSVTRTGTTKTGMTVTSLHKFYQMYEE